MKTMKLILVILIGLLATNLLAQQNTITGKVQDASDKSPVGYANIILLNQDSSFVSGTTTGFDGDFEIKYTHGDYILSVSCIGYTSRQLPVGSSFDNKGINISLSPSAVALDEITIVAQSVTVKEDRKLIIPSQEQVRSATDGTDMVRKMQLPRIMVDPVSGEITMSGDQTIQLRINGVLVTNAEIAAVPPSDIIRIEYYDDPGVRYGNAVAVIDFIVRRNESGGHINGAFYNGLGKKRMSADERLSLKYNHGKSEWSANAVYLQRKGYWTREYDEWLIFPNSGLHRVETGEPTLFNKKTFSGNLNYSLADKNYLFNVQATYRQNDFPNAFEDRRSTLCESDQAPLSISDHTTEKSHSPVIDLYFQRHLVNEQQLIFNIVGTYIGTDSKRTYNETRNHVPETDFYSHISGNKYSLIAEMIYEKKSGSNKITGGLRHLQAYASNNYNGIVTADISMNQTETQAYAEYQGRAGKWGYMANAAAVHLYYSQEGRTVEKYALQPSARITFTPDRNSYLRYRINLHTNMPSLAAMNDVEQSVNRWLVRRGNPNLKPFRTLSQNFTAGYNQEIGGIELTAGYDYEYKPIMESVFYENQKFIYIEDNQKSFQNLNAEVSLRLKPWKNHIGISATPRVNHFISEGNDYRHTYTMYELRVNFDFSYNNWIVNFTTITPPRFMYGEHVTKSNQMYSILAGYKMPQWSLMVGVLNPFMSKYETDNESWSAINPVRSQIHTANTQSVLVKLAINLNYGKQFKNENKRTNNVDTDSGIMQGTRN